MFLKKVNMVKSHFHICQVKIMLLLLLLLLWQWSIKNNANNAGIFLSSVKPECREWQASAPTTLQANAWAAEDPQTGHRLSCPDQDSETQQYVFHLQHRMLALPASQQIQLQQYRQLCAKITYVIVPCPHKSIWQHIRQSFPYPGRA